MAGVLWDDGSWPRTTLNAMIGDPYGNDVVDVNDMSTVGRTFMLIDKELLALYTWVKTAVPEKRAKRMRGPAAAVVELDG